LMLLSIPMLFSVLGEIHSSIALVNELSRI
jgi:hypothetical protein